MYFEQTNVSKIQLTKVIHLGILTLVFAKCKSNYWWICPWEESSSSIYWIVESPRTIFASIGQTNLEYNYHQVNQCSKNETVERIVVVNVKNTPAKSILIRRFWANFCFERWLGECWPVPWGHPSAVSSIDTENFKENEDVTWSSPSTVVLQLRPVNNTWHSSASFQN